MTIGKRRAQAPEPVSEGVRRLLDTHVADHTPGADATDRVWRRLQASVHETAEAERDDVVIARARRRWPSPATLVLGCVAAAVVAMLGIRYGVRALSPARRATPAAASSALQDDRAVGQAKPRRVTAPRPADRPEPAPGESVAPEPVEERPEAATIERPSRRPAPKVARPSAVDDRLRSLADELQILEAAQVALRNGDPERALQVLDRHARDFAQAKLQEERKALRAIALCQAGRMKQGRGEAKVFVKTYPASTVASRVREACRLGH